MNNSDLRDRLLRLGGATTKVGKRVDLREYERDLPELDAVLSVAAPSILERTWARLQQGEDYGAELPWPKMRNVYRARPGEVTAWIGPNSDGKSLHLNFAGAHWAWHGQRVLYASLEMPVEEQLERLAVQFLCKEPHRITRRELEQLAEHWSETITFWDFAGACRPERMIALCRYAARALNCQHVIVDNMTMIVPPGRTSDEIGARFVAGLKLAAREDGCHIHLVGHIRKPDDFKHLTRYDWRGTGAAPDVVDNVAIVQRNDLKYRKGRVVEGAENDPDAFIAIDKYRSIRGSSSRVPFGFWFYDVSKRLAENGNEPPQPYL